MINLLLLLGFSFSASAYFCSPEDLEKLARDISIPNCVTKEVFRDLKSDNPPEELCNSCKNKFEVNLGRKIAAVPKDELQQTFFNSALEEYKKNIINNIISVTKLRSLPSTGETFAKSLNSCKLKDPKELIQNCGSASAKKLLKDSKAFSEISNAIKNELAKVLSTTADFNPQNTLLKRNAHACFVPEKDILLFSNATLEEELTPNLINYFKSFNTETYKTVDDLLQSPEFENFYGEKAKDLRVSIKSHPVFSAYLKDSKKFAALFSAVKTPQDLINLRKALYNKATGSDFDKTLSTNCENSYAAFTKSICSNEFENGKIDPDYFKNFKRWPAAKLEASKNEFTTSEADIELNINILRMCKTTSDPKELNLNSVNAKISEGINDGFQMSNLDQYKVEKYDSEIGRLNDSICEYKNNPSKVCEPSTSMFCRTIKKFTAPTELDIKLATTSNKEVNSLLRSMIGEDTNIEPKTKEILIAEGILPKADGKVVSQSETPRTPEEFSTQNNNTPAPATVKNTTTGAQAATAITPRRNFRDSVVQDSDYVTNSTSTSNSATETRINNLLEDNEELRNIQREIQRRISGLPNKKPSSKEEARKITKQAFADFKHPLPSNVEEAFVQDLMAPEPSRAPASNAFANSSSAGTPSVSPGPTKAEKAFQAANAALLAAQPSSTDSSSQDAANQSDKPREMTKVAINVSEDPKVNLSDLFNNKINQNDSETQLLKVLLKNKTNFLLQVKSVNFKVMFNDKNQFNILLDSGNRADAERIRPQLEMFLKKLKV